MLSGRPIDCWLIGCWCYQVAPIKTSGSTTLRHGLGRIPQQKTSQSEDFSLQWCVQPRWMGACWLVPSVPHLLLRPLCFILGCEPVFRHYGPVQRVVDLGLHILDWIIVPPSSPRIFFCTLLLLGRLHVLRFHPGGTAPGGLREIDTLALASPVAARSLGRLSGLGLWIPTTDHLPDAPERHYQGGVCPVVRAG
jgi:hypothetical protein